MTLAALARFGYSYPLTSGAALDAVDLDIDSGVLLVTGASGSGKSTLLRVFNGLVPHFHGGTVRGRALVFGRDVVASSTRELARHVGFVFQDPELQSVHATVEHDVAFGLENLGVARSEMISRVGAALESTGIGALRARAVTTLSGGERQRLALAGVLAMQPRLLVLDEPLSQLDTQGARALLETLDGVARGGTAVIVAEHRLEWLTARVTRVVALEHGRLSESTPPRGNVTVTGPEVFRRPSGERRAWHLHRVTAGPARTPIVHDVDLHGAAGEVVALIGPNGSGKTTLLRTIAGLLAPLSGHVERTTGRIAYLPQNPTSLLHRRTVRAEVEWTLRHEGSRTRASDTLAEFGLAGVADRYPRDLSTGERQRAAIAAVLAARPVVALLDEPTRGMDTEARGALCRAVARITGCGGSVVIATHDLALVRAVSDRVVELGDGVVSDVPLQTSVPA